MLARLNTKCKQTDCARVTQISPERLRGVLSSSPTTLKHLRTADSSYNIPSTPHTQISMAPKFSRPNPYYSEDASDEPASVQAFTTMVEQQATLMGFDLNNANHKLAVRYLLHHGDLTNPASQRLMLMEIYGKGPGKRIRSTQHYLSAHIY